MGLGESEGSSAIAYRIQNTIFVISFPIRLHSFFINYSALGATRSTAVLVSTLYLFELMTPDRFAYFPTYHLWLAANLVMPGMWGGWFVMWFLGLRFWVTVHIKKNISFLYIKRKINILLYFLKNVCCLNVILT